MITYQKSCLTHEGQHGSTFGGSALSCKVAMASLRVMEDEGLAENAEVLGRVFRSELANSPSKTVKIVRGKGLFNAVVIEDHINSWDVCLEMAKNGILTKPTHNNTIRFTPPLIITQPQLEESLEMIKKSFEKFSN